MGLHKALYLSLGDTQSLADPNVVVCQYYGVTLIGSTVIPVVEWTMEVSLEVWQDTNGRVVS